MIRRCVLFLMAACAASAPVGAVPPVPTTPAPIDQVILAKRFEVETPFPYRWSAEGIEVREGWLLVLEADPALIRPRESAEPVLFVGERPAQRLSRGGRSGRMVVIVPAMADLRRAALFFGSPGLPEAVGSRDAKRESARARASGIVLDHAREFARAMRRGGDALTLADYNELLAEAYRLIQDYVLPYDTGAEAGRK